MWLNLAQPVGKLSIADALATVLVRARHLKRASCKPHPLPVTSPGWGMQSWVPLLPPSLLPPPPALTKVILGWNWGGGGIEGNP